MLAANRGHPDMIKLTWEIVDGYAGRSRPQHSQIDPQDFIGMSLEEAQQALSDFLDEEVKQRVSWRLDDFDDVVKKLMTAAKELE
jgi:hypothetical protein